MMFHKIKNVAPLADYKLSVQFCEGITKLYDIKPLFDKLPVFETLKENQELFYNVAVDVGGYGVVSVTVDHVSQPETHVLYQNDSRRDGLEIPPDFDGACSCRDDNASVCKCVKNPGSRRNAENGREDENQVVVSDEWFF